MKHLQKIEIYEATKQEADTKETNLSLMVDSRTEDCHKLLIAKLIQAKPSLVITINQRSSASVANLRTDSDIMRKLINDGKNHIFVRDYCVCAFETWLSG